MSDEFFSTTTNKDEHDVAASAFDVANEMNFVMNYIADNNNFGITKDTEWVASGYSTGSIVVQAFMAIHPIDYVAITTLTVCHTV